MNKNAVIGVLLALLILGGGYIMWASRGGSPSPTATTTPPTQQPRQTPPEEPTAGAPKVVTESATLPTNSTVVFTGRVVPNGAPTTYWYEYGETTALGTRTPEQSIGSGFASIPTQTYVAGLKANTTYYFRLNARNRFSVVEGDTSSFRTNANPPTPPGSAPTVSTSDASDISRTTANLSGRVDPNGSETSYWFEYGEDTTFGKVTSFQSAGNGDSATAVSNSVSGLNPLTKYYYRLNAQNQYGTVNGAIQSFTTQGPAAPGRPAVDTTAASSVATSSAALNARINPNGATTTYWFEYSEDSLLGSIIGSSTGAQTISGNNAVNVSVSVSGLKKDTKYFYRAVARNQYGTVHGDIVSFTTRK